MPLSHPVEALPSPSLPLFPSPLPLFSNGHVFADVASWILDYVNRGFGVGIDEFFAEPLFSIAHALV